MVAPVVAAALISGISSVVGAAMQNAQQKGQAPGLPQIGSGGPGGGQTLGNTAAKILEASGKGGPASQPTGAALAGASPQQLGMQPIDVDHQIVPINAPKDTPHNQTLKEVITGKGAEIKAPTTDDIIKKGELKTKGDGMFSDMSTLEKVALASSVASAVFAQRPGPAPPGLPNISGPNLKPTI